MKTKEEIFTENLKLVTYAYHKEFQRYRSYQEDLIQEGYFALWRACLGFDETRGIEFSTYAYKSIKTSMLNYIVRFVEKYKNVVSFEESVPQAEGLSYIDLLPQEEDNSSKELIQETLMKVSRKDRYIIEQIMSGYTQESIAQKMGTSQSSISRCLQRFRNLLLQEELYNEQAN